MTDQPADLDRLRRALADYDRTGRDHDAHELAAEIPALIAEIERLRAVTENLLNQLGAAADKLLALGWNDVAAQMEAGTYRPTADPNRCRCGAMWGHRHAESCIPANTA
jgi:HPt (histidine-containing phosphotransfer) domain-containing protein